MVARQVVGRTEGMKDEGVARYALDADGLALRATDGDPGLDDDGGRARELGAVGAGMSEQRPVVGVGRAPQADAADRRLKSVEESGGWLR